MSASEFVSTFFTPTNLFIFLNLIIGTIYITSRRAKPHPTSQAATLGRVPSSLIDRVRSIDLSFFKFESHPEPDPVHYHYNPGIDSAVVDGPLLAPSPSLLERLRSINFYQKKFEHPDPEPEQLHPAEAVYNSAVGREQPPLSRAPSLLDQLKSIKFPSFYNPGEENLDTESDHEDVDGPAEDHAHVPVRRIRSEWERMGEQGPMPGMRKMAREKSAATAENNVEVEEIDAKADDFIQRFRQQLKMQRLDSLMRYKDLLAGGGAGSSR